MATTVELTASEVFDFTGGTVTDNEIALAANLIDEQTAYTVVEHVDERAVPILSVKAAWAMVAVRVARMMRDDAQLAVTSETQGDYSYSEDSRLAVTHRFSSITDGRPQQLLQLARARWAHI